MEPQNSALEDDLSLLTGASLAFPSCILPEVEFHAGAL